MSYSNLFFDYKLYIWAYYKLNKYKKGDYHYGKENRKISDRKQKYTVGL